MNGENVIVTWRDHAGAHVEESEGRISITVPDQSHSLQEILERFTRSGVEIPQRDMIFLGEEEVPNWEYMQRVEQMQVAAELRRVIATRKDRLAELEREGVEVAEEDLPTLSDPVEVPDAQPPGPPENPDRMRK